MARAGMTRWRTRNTTSNMQGNDEVQRSLELLDHVLSEFDNFENGNSSADDADVEKTSTAETVRSQSAPAWATTTTRQKVAEGSQSWNRGAVGGSGGSRGFTPISPEYGSPSLGHQSEDDGYMSMNGKRTKFVLNFCALPDADDTDNNSDANMMLSPPSKPLPAHDSNTESLDCPPAPEEAERIISTLLPRVSPGTFYPRSNWEQERAILDLRNCSFQGSISNDTRVSSATQTTLPKTRHRRPYGWETDNTSIPQIEMHERYVNGGKKFGSLPYDGIVHFPPVLPGSFLRQGQGSLSPWTVSSSGVRHREVRRCDSTDCDITQSSSCGVLKPLSELTDDELVTFSDDSLEEMTSTHHTPSIKKSSVAWEVPLNDAEEEALYVPGSTKVIGRRRRKSSDRSSSYNSGSVSSMRDIESWSGLPISPSLRSDSCSENIHAHTGGRSSSDHTPCGTYVIRRGRRKETIAPLAVKQKEETSNHLLVNNVDLKRCSSTFDNIKCLLKEGLVDGLDETPPDFAPPLPPNMTRVVSLPILAIDEKDEETLSAVLDKNNQITDLDLSSSSSNCCSDSGDKLNDDFHENLDCESLENEFDITHLAHPPTAEKIVSKSNEFLSEPAIEMPCPVNDDTHEDTETDKSDVIEVPTEETVKSKVVDRESQFESAGKKTCDHLCCRTLEISQVQVTPVLERRELAKKVTREDPSSIALNINVHVEVVQHNFGPLPPSPVVEEDDEYSDILHLTANKSPSKRKPHKPDISPEPSQFYNRLDSPSSTHVSSRYSERPPNPPPHRDSSFSSLKTRSMDAGSSRSYRNQFAEIKHRRDIPSERQTLPTDMPGPSQRKTSQKRNGHCSREESHMQNSCSLPETPIFSRGCDIPRTSHRRAPDIPSVARTTHRCGMQTTGYLQQSMSAGRSGGVNLGQVMTGGELLRLAGGPGRGWYPRQRQSRPASVEHLDRLVHYPHPAAPWESNTARKPLTLPPNLTPKFFHRSPREALRRVTSLLIRNKGSSHKETEEADMLSSSIISPHGETFGEPSTRSKKGFFRRFWKRSRHYSLEQK